jgi:hypothetical protein
LPIEPPKAALRADDDFFARGVSEKGSEAAEKADRELLDRSEVGDGCEPPGSVWPR